MKQTSKEAHQNSRNFKATHHRIIINALNKLKKATYNEIAEECNFRNPNQVSRRMKELVDKGKVIELEPVICKIAGTKCTQYKLTKSVKKNLIIKNN